MNISNFLIKLEPYTVFNSRDIKLCHYNIAVKSEILYGSEVVYYFHLDKIKPLNILKLKKKRH